MMTQPLTDCSVRCWQKMLEVGTIVRKLSSCRTQEEAVNFSDAQMRVMEVLFANNGKPVMLKFIGEKLNLSPGAVSKTVAALEKSGMIERSIVKHDLRAVLVAPTTFARQYREKHEQKFENLLLELLAEENEADVAVFNQVLSRMRNRAHAKLAQMV